VAINIYLAGIIFVYFLVSYYFSIPYSTISNTWGIRALIGSKIILKGNFFGALFLVVSSLAGQLAVSLIIYYASLKIGANIFIQYLFNCITDFINVFYKLLCIIWFLGLHYRKMAASIMGYMEKGNDTRE
jgi:hypothetical protein